jgi:ribosomal-protein-alanine N-acetyltransferase
MKYSLAGQETKRLKFRLLNIEDFDDWVNLFKGKNVAKFLGMDPKLSEKELCDIWFNKTFQRSKKETGVMNALIDKKTNLLIGQCGLLIQSVQNIERLEIGYSILPKYWGNGYATEAAMKCKNYAFANKLADSLISMVHIENIGSEKVALKNGMTWEQKIDSYEGSPMNIFRIDWKDKDKDRDK